jgi:serine O-acetyltransferase
MCKVYTLYKCANTLHRLKIPAVPRLIYYMVRIFFGGHVPYTATIGSGTWFGCGALGVVLHPLTVIGQNCVIAQNVTIGGRANHPDVPKLGNNVFVGAGAKILGPVTIGDNVKIGANAVVIGDVPANSTVVGIPARVVTSQTILESS